MAKNNPIQDINVRKQMLKLQIRQQEMEIERDFKGLGEYFTFPAMKNSALNYIVNNPETAFRAGVVAVNIFSKIFQGRKKPARRATRKPTGKK